MIAPLLLAALTATAAVHHRVSTQNPQAQTAFDLGLTLLYSYDGDDAYQAFAQALDADPHLAMAQWGEALASGTDLNTALDAGRFARAQQAAQQAQALESYASPEERAYIDAVVQRYAGAYAARDADETLYRARMAALVAAYPADNDAAMLDAEALLEHLGTDRMWTDNGAQPVPDAATALSLIHTVLARDPQHIMANHLCMHAYDYAADRTPAIACADRIAADTFLPQEEHLAHMPAHTYIETGEYAKAILISERAWRMRESTGSEKYAAHDAYTGWSAAMMLGDRHVAETWAIRTGQAYNGSDLWATWARFGQWQRIAGSSASGEFYAPLSRGLTDVHFGVMNDARSMLALYGNADTDYRWILQSAIDEHSGDIGAAATDLDRALAYQTRTYGGETLPLFPAGEFLGALYYRHGLLSQAEAAFTVTLHTYPNDPRALYGLALVQQRLGQAVTSQQTLKAFSQIWVDPTPPDLADL